jgi:serine/threonine protein phosphatase PrpC
MEVIIIYSGKEVSHYLKKYFTTELVANIKSQSGNIEQALTDTFLKLDLKLYDEAKEELLTDARRFRQEEESKPNIKEKNKQMDMFKSLFDPIYIEDCNIAMFTGSTACVCVIDNEFIYFANAGDSGAIICKKGKIKQVTKEHKPENEEEKTRIYNAGGTVIDRRVGNLNLSRSIGDLEYKMNKRLKPEQQMITANPEITKINRKDMDFIVIACDGVWDCKEYNISDFIYNKLKDENVLSRIIEELFDVIISKESRDDGVGCDNMTCIIIQFK